MRNIRAKIKNDYSKVAEYKGNLLTITITNYEEPIISTDTTDFYCQFIITLDGNKWGHAFLPDPVEDFEQAAKDILANIEAYKTHELN